MRALGDDLALVETRQALREVLKLGADVKAGDGVVAVGYPEGWKLLRGRGHLGGCISWAVHASSGPRD